MLTMKLPVEVDITLGPKDNMKFYGHCYYVSF